MDIDFIYFDVGGVVILDFSKTNKWNKLLSDLGVKECDKNRLNEFFEKEEPKFCTGEKSSETFIKILKNEFDIQLQPDYSFLNDFVKRFEPNIKIHPIIKKLKTKYKIGLLTNMYPEMLDLIIQSNLLPDVHWDIIIDSSIEGFIKPQQQIFDLALSRAGTRAENTLLVENSKMHIDKAKNLGWQTFLYDPAEVEKSNRELLNLIS